MVLSSCKKDWTCTCKGDQQGTIVLPIQKQKKAMQSHLVLQQKLFTKTKMLQQSVLWRRNKQGIKRMF
jgi:hypothetical protein